MIKKIIIANIKGIGADTKNGTFEFDIPKNKPSIFVAPNGFGKSSLATAFKSLKRSKIDLHKNDFYKGNEEITPSIDISYLDDDGNIQTVAATDLTNNIDSVFDWFVINNQVFAKAKKNRIGGHVIATASLETPPVILSNSIPERLTFNYSVADQKARFGINGKVLPNISRLYNNRELIKLLRSNLVYLDRISGQRIQERIDTFIQKVNIQNGSKVELLEWIDENEIDFLADTSNLSNIASIFNSFDLGFLTDAENYLAAIQMSYDYNNNTQDFKKAVNRSIYELEKEIYERLFQDFNSSWKDFKPKEKDGKLIVEIPKAHHISNGQRDVMCFIALLKKAELSLTKKRSILIIDEVFDYLDDANLIAVQYYITQLIAKFRSEDRMFYPIILTHLDPSFFKNFTFSKQKIFYLEKKDAKINEHMKKLLINRAKPEIECRVSKYHLHFEPLSINIRQEFESLGLKPTWGNSAVFDQYVFSEFTKYINNETVYDPFAVCCAVRKKIERYAYDKLNDEGFKHEFLSTHKTSNKLKFSEKKGVTIPESFHLLGIIYNDGMHWKNNEVAISGKLENMTIKKMIREIE
ncbi:MULTISPECIES: hypothetical protein [Colwellia]|uniref:Uncharacterized protein n=1 Tax=Colwellia marinimaniae TaxID=1513592 RepID=A0ABQ0MWD8_9GAMM|nr:MULTISPECIES: hypothetical protein [Colwellia]GAW96684.1 hypothetical protein MTCD1_02304 [Colwellia marinimaniae]